MFDGPVEGLNWFRPSTTTSDHCGCGGSVSRALWSDIGLKLGVVLGLLNPHRIVLGGGVAKAG
jgi:hypothetical protein